MKLLKHLSVLVLLIFLISCDGDENQNASINRDFFTNSELEISGSIDNGFNPLLTEGDQLVFRYSFNHPEDKDISDDELTEVFWLQIPQGQTNFNFQSLEPNDANAITIAYQRLCFCGQINFEVQSYNIQSTQISPTEWRIQFSMDAKDESRIYPLSDQGIYTRSTN